MSLSDIKMYIQSLCSPAKLYLGFAVIAVIFSSIGSFSILSVLFSLLFIGFWTFIINWVCEKGYEKVAWFFVLLPFIIILIKFIISLQILKTIYSKISEKKEEHKKESDEQKSDKQTEEKKESDEQIQEKKESDQQKSGEKEIVKQVIIPIRQPNMNYIYPLKQYPYDSQYTLILNPTQTIHEQHLDPTVYSTQNRQYKPY